MKNKGRKHKSIYLWKLIVVIAIIFSVAISIEAFFLIEKTVKKIVVGFSGEYGSAILTEEEENSNNPQGEGTTNAEGNDNEADIPDDANAGSELPGTDENDGSEKQPTDEEKPNENVTADNTTATNTNTVADGNSNTVANETSTNTNTVNENTVTNTVNTNTIDTNTVNTNTVNTVADNNTVKSENTVGNSNTVANQNVVSDNTLVDSDEEDSESNSTDEDEENSADAEEMEALCNREHMHIELCYRDDVSDEDRESILEIIDMISEIPLYEEIEQNLKAFENAGSTEEYNQYFMLISENVKSVCTYYEELKERIPELCVYITDIERVLDLKEILEVETLEEMNATGIKAQYYAYLKVISKTKPVGCLRELKVIDTSKASNGGKIAYPKNGDIKDPNNHTTTKLIYVNKNNNIDLKDNELLEIYDSKTDYSLDMPTPVSTFSRFDERDDGYYKLKSIWILKDGANENSVNEGDWNIIDYRDGLYFTNDNTDQKPDAIYLKSNDVIRYVCDIENGNFTNETMFYDYDITDGYIYTDTTWGKKRNRDTLDFNRTDMTKTTSTSLINVYVKSKEQGINSLSNYNTTATGRNNRLGFGNANTGTNLGTTTWQSPNGVTNKINTYNRIDGITYGFEGCTFGMVTGLKEDKTLKYAKNLKAPKLFNEPGTVKGKTPYSDYKLEFLRHGDTYRLTSVSLNNKILDSAKNLEQFHTPVREHPDVYTHIWTNDFWPMDSVPDYNKTGHDVMFGKGMLAIDSKGNKSIVSARSIYCIKEGSTKGTAILPTCDDGVDHNAYFGMHFTIDFYMVDDYRGPLEYYFFGDDDMWVFLDNELIIDIGGVHSSVGEYVNLWDYIAMEDRNNQKHKLSFFYMERGGSGSVCWMQFNLPHPLNASTPMEDRGILSIRKEIQDSQETDENFQFQVNFKDSTGANIEKQFDFIGPKKNGKIKSGDIIELSNNEEISIYEIPVGTTYEIKEIPKEEHKYDYLVTSEKATGTIKKGEIKAKFTNIPNLKAIKVKKQWEHYGSEDKPTKLKVKLVATTQAGVDCEEYIKQNYPDYVVFEKELNEANNWEYVWGKLPKYKVQYNAAGTQITSQEEINYTFKEIDVPDEYFLKGDPIRTRDEEIGCDVVIITNSRKRNIILTKVDSEDLELKLGGVEFKLQKLLVDKNTEIDLTKCGKLEVDTSFAERTVISSVQEETLGRIELNSLENGIYRLTETKTLDGYNLLKKPIHIYIRNNVVKVINNANIDVINDANEVPVYAGIIKNKQGVKLSETGGSGTKKITITGISILTLSVYFVYSNRRVTVAPRRKKVKRRRFGKRHSRKY